MIYYYIIHHNKRKEKTIEEASKQSREGKGKLLIQILHILVNTNDLIYKYIYVYIPESTY